MKVAIYARVSTKEQNVNTQLNLCREACERCGYEIFKEYVDIGESGRKYSRPQFDEMLIMMRRYRFHAIMVYKIDRIGRSMAHLVNLFEEFQKKKVHFISVTQNIDSTTAEGRMFMRMMMVLAEYEREMTVDRVKSGIKRARKEGKQIGRPKTGINGFHVMQLKEKGLSLRKIATELNCSLGTVQRCIKKQRLNYV
jgi:putative DNA-invertase from lambdoid prophage Rac